jgi:predicted extracellular nuclease
VTRTGSGEVTPVTIGADGRRPPTEVVDDDGFTTYDPATDGVDFWESLEGMALRLPDAVALSPTFTSRFGDSETFVLPDGTRVASNVNSSGGVTLTERDANPERVAVQEDNRVLDNDFATKVGDRLGEVVGVLDYDSRGNYEVIPTRAFSVTDGGLRKDTGSMLRGAEDALLIATYNVENLNPASDRFDALAADIEAMNLPDILALQEVQDANGPTNDAVVSGEATAAALIAAIEARTGQAGQYAYIEIPPGDDTSGGAPGPTSASATSTAPTGWSRSRHHRQVPDPDDADGFAWEDSRVPLAVDFRLGEEVVTVVNNHLVSKGGSSPVFGSIQPLLNGGEAQRVDQAEAVGAFVSDLIARDPAAKVVVLGDLNEFEWEDAFRALTGGDEPILFDLQERLQPLPVERTSYVFDGNHQALDHILVSLNLLDGAAVDVLRVNAQFPDGSSDHDPLLARLVLSDASPIG